MPNRPASHNKPVVTVVEPGRTFAFARTEPFGGTVEWRYRFTPDGNGTLVDRVLPVTKPVSRMGWFIIGTLFGRKNRQTDLHAGMTETLERLAHADRHDTAMQPDSPPRRAAGS